MVSNGEIDDASLGSLQYEAISTRVECLDAGRECDLLLRKEKRLCWPTASIQPSLVCMEAHRAARDQHDYDHSFIDWLFTCACWLWPLLGSVDGSAVNKNRQSSEPLVE